MSGGPPPGAARRRPATAATRPPRLTLAQARRIALAAQGLQRPRPTGRVDRRHVRALLQQVGLVQIDSVNVLVRSHELPLWSRLGPHPRGTLEELGRRGEVFEYWAHEASFLPVQHWPLYRYRMEPNHWVLRGSARVERERPGYLEAVYQEVARHGPVTASELADPGEKTGPWWGWNHGKQALEVLFATGRVSARRRSNFEREYDLVERVLPPEVLAVPPPDEDEARAVLVEQAARSLGVATAADLFDYHRLNNPKSRPTLQKLVAEGVLEPVEVEGWKDTAYLHPASRQPRRVVAATVLSPFDSLVWFRPRTERLFGFRYRLELYTPAPKRVFGYYVLPFLLDDRLVGRLDLKADRHAGVLRVPAAHVEPGADHREVAAAMAGELQALAAWLGLGDVVVADRGNLAGALRPAVSLAARG
jgi:uncharacterized protein